MKERDVKKWYESVLTSDRKCKAQLKELFLDTKGNCFLCLREIIDSPVHESKGVTEFCFRNVCRYLNMDPISILVRGLGGIVLNETKDTSPPSKDKHCDFSVKLCTNCSVVSEKLSLLICKQEELKLYLSHQLQLFHEILKTSDQKSEGAGFLWKKIQENTGSSKANSVEAHLVQHLRHETKEKCSKRLEKLNKHNVPKVQLVDLMRAAPGPPPASTNHSQQSPSNSSVSKILPPILNPFWIKDEEAEKSSPINVNVTRKNSHNENSYKSISLNPVGEANDDARRKMLIDICESNCVRLNSMGHHKCLICDKICPFPYKIREHLVNVHPEKFFLSTKFERISEAKFKDYCRRVLSAETKHAARQSGTTCQDRKIICRVCNERYANGNALRVHMVLDHYPVLEEKLNNLQQIIESSNFLLNQPPEVNSKQMVREICENYFTKVKIDGKIRFDCGICKKNFENSSKARRHLVCVHTEMFFTSNKLPQGSKKKVKEYCDSVLRTEARQAARQSGTGTSANRNIFCRVCNETCYGPTGLRFHMVLHHYDILEEKLINLIKIGGSKRKDNQTQSFSQEERLKPVAFQICGNTGNGNLWKTTRWPENTISKSTKGLLSSVVCTSCDRKFSNKWHLNRHKRESCPITKQHRVVWTCNSSSGGCGKKMSSRFALNRHKSHSCPKRKSSGKFPLAKSISISNNNIPWKRRTCGKCNRKFLSRDSLLMHKKINKDCQADDDTAVALEAMLIEQNQSSLPLPEETPNYCANNSSSLETDSASKPDQEEWDQETFDSVTCFCGKPFAGRRMIECQKCLVWYHFSCVGIRTENIPPNFQFQCSICKNFAKS